MDGSMAIRLTTVRLGAVAALSILLFASCATGDETGPRTEGTRPRPFGADALGALTSPAPSSPVPARRPSIPHFESISRAVAFIATRVDEPVELPAIPLPGLRLAAHDPVRVTDFAETGREVTLNLLFGRHGVLQIDYGRPALVGCDYPSYGAREIRVGRYPALLLTHPRYGWSLILWPATLQKLVGRYELRGTLSGPQIVRLAESMRPVAGLEAQRPNPGC
jgi:hypothetical protein